MILSPIGDIRVVVKTSGILKSKGRKGPSIILTSTKIKVDRPACSDQSLFRNSLSCTDHGQ